MAYFQINTSIRRVLLTALVCLSSNLILSEDSTASSLEEHISIAKRLVSKMTPDEKIGQLCKARGFNAYSVDKNGNIALVDEYKSSIKKIGHGTVYGLLRADWWANRNSSNGITLERVNQAVNLFQDEYKSASRFGIGTLFVEEAPHGLCAIGATVFPVNLSIGSTFNKELAYKIAKAVSEEAYACGIHSVYSPVLDVVRDPRWSRVEECFGEDSYLVSELGRQYVRGILAGKTFPTLKHFVGGGASEGGLNTWNVSVGLRELWNTHLRPFKYAIDAGAQQCIMPTYHDVDGQHASASKLLLTDILRGKLGFKGYLTADGGVIPMMHNRGMGASIAETAAYSLKSGCDSDSGHEKSSDCGYYYKEAYNLGLISDDDLDLAATRVLTVKSYAGCLSNDNRELNPEKVLRNKYHKDLALQAAREGCVLLKNDGLLPLDAGKYSAIAVIGPNADNPMNQLGDYTSNQGREDIITVFDGLKELLKQRNPQAKVVYAKGCSVRSKSTDGFKEAIDAAKNAEVIVFVAGGSSTRFGDIKTDPLTGAAVTDILSDGDSDKDCGEGTDSIMLEYSGRQMELLGKLKSLGKPIVCVGIQGRPLLLNAAFENCGAFLMAWYPGEMGGRAVAEILFGEYNPAGRLSVSIPERRGQMPVYYASKCDRKKFGYFDGPAVPLLEFGFGLSYTKFKYSDLKIDGKKIYVNVTNTGGMDGDEVVQFYISALSSPVQRPWRQLFAFERVHLKAGETKRVSAEIDSEKVGAYNKSGDIEMYEGFYNIFVGGSLRIGVERKTRLLAAGKKVPFGEAFNSDFVLEEVK